MLTAELVRAVRKKGELKLLRLDAAARARAEELAAAYVELFRAHVGRSREELEESLTAVESEPRERVLSRGLKKLLEDRAVFDAVQGLDPIELRAELFQEAAQARKQSEERLDRRTVIDRAAERRGIPAAEIERALFSDLRSAHALEKFDAISAPQLVDAWERGQTQGVLLRAVRVRVEVECASPSAYRALFRRLKFLRLLYTLAPREGGGYILDIDGPFALFEQSTKYGLELAVFYPALESCERWKLEAVVRWGNTREPLIFRTEGGTASTQPGEAPADLPDEVRDLLERFGQLGSRWSASIADDLLHLPGLGLITPDLVFECEGTRVHLEVLGFWSRDAVWKRVELVEKGLRAPMVFAVSSRLRVSEEALADELPAALYVYKGSMSAKAILEKIEAVAAKSGARTVSR